MSTRSATSSRSRPSSIAGPTGPRRPAPSPCRSSDQWSTATSIWSSDCPRRSMTRDRDLQGWWRRPVQPSRFTRTSSLPSKLNEDRIPALDEWVRERDHEERVTRLFRCESGRHRTDAGDRDSRSSTVRSTSVIDDASRRPLPKAVRHSTRRSRSSGPAASDVLEDWDSATPRACTRWTSRPLTNLLLELQVAWTKLPNLLEEIVTVPSVSVIRRGLLQAGSRQFRHQRDARRLTKATCTQPERRSRRRPLIV